VEIHGISEGVPPVIWQQGSSPEIMNGQLPERKGGGGCQRFPWSFIRCRTCDLAADTNFSVASCPRSRAGGVKIDTGFCRMSHL
jgi:hypothetical protein